MQPWQEPELEEIRSRHAQFAVKELVGGSSTTSESTGFSREQWRTCADLGVLGGCLEEKYGGGGLPLTHLVAAYEGLGYGSNQGGLIFGLCSQLLSLQMTLQMTGSPQLKERYLPGLISGRLIGAHAITERGAGSDAFSIQTAARREGERFRLSGSKAYVTAAPDADLALVFARTSDEAGPFCLTAFLVDLGWNGVSRGEVFHKAGLKGIEMGELPFEEVPVPMDHVVGAEGGGVGILAESTGWERALLPSTLLGPMQRSIDSCTEWARKREQFRRPIGAFQQVSARIANMVVRHQICRQTVYDMAARLQQSATVHPLTQQAAIVKLFVTESAIQVQLDALQVMGVRGYLEESNVQQDLKDSLAGTLWSGTSETLRNTIARFAGLPTTNS